MGFFQDLFGVGGDGGSGATMDEALNEIRNLKSPTADDLTYRLDNLVQQGVITPDQAKTFLMQRSSMEDVSTDPRLRSAQLGALSSLQEIGQAGGLTAMDRSKIDALTSRLGQEERGGREAIVQHAAEQGRSGTPLELMALLEGQQGAATRGAQEGTDIAALAEQRALESITQAGALGGQIRGQDFGEKSDVAQAKDALAKFNAEHLQGTEMANVAARNAAQQQNLSERQRIADTNTATAGKNREIAVSATQQAYDDEMKKRETIANALAAKAKDQEEKAKQHDAFVGNLVGTAGTVASSLVAKSDKNSKNIENGIPDLDAFMATLKPAAFTYKDPSSAGAAPGENVGVMAQDVEKTPVGRTMVKNTPDGKMLDMQKGFGIVLAGLASLHDKYEELEKKYSSKAA